MSAGGDERDRLDRARRRRRGPRRRSSAASLGGGVAVFPADGLYGLACDPLDAAAIERIHEIKGRDDGKPSAVLYFSPLAMRELLERPRRAHARRRSGRCCPGPVTLVVANPERRYPLACREDPERLGVRLIGGPLAGALLPDLPDQGQPQRRAGAVALRRRRPATIVAAADLAIDGGELTGLPSTVVDLDRDRGRRRLEGAARGRLPAAT